MTTTNMFLNFGGKWDSPPLPAYLTSLSIHSLLKHSVLRDQFALFSNPAYMHIKLDWREKLMSNMTDMIL